MQIWDYFVLPTRRNYCEENGSKEERLLWKESGLPWKRTDASVCKEQVLLKWGVYLSALEFLKTNKLSSIQGDGLPLQKKGQAATKKRHCFEEGWTPERRGVLWQICSTSNKMLYQ